MTGVSLREANGNTELAQPGNSPVNQRQQGWEVMGEPLGLAKLSSTFLSNGFKVLIKPAASAAKFGLKNVCYIGEVTPVLGQVSDTRPV